MSDELSATISIGDGPEVDLDAFMRRLRSISETVSADDIEQIEEQIAELSAERSRLERVEEPLCEQGRLTSISTRLSDLRQALAAAKRRRAVARLAGYALNRPSIDRAKHLEVCLGDVNELLVNAQLNADEGMWESAAEQLKQARRRLADAVNLADLVNDLALGHSHGAQLALPLE